MVFHTDKIMFSFKICTVLMTMLMALPFTVNADEADDDDTYADRAFEYFDKDSDGQLNDGEKALAHKAHHVIDYNDDGRIGPK